MPEYGPGVRICPLSLLHGRYKTQNKMQSRSFSQIVEDHQRMVYAIALRITCESGTAEEVAQDVFMELFRSSERIHDDDHVKPWLRRVAVHRATDALRKRARQPEQHAEEWKEEHSSHADEPLDLDQQTRIGDLLRSLPDAMRTALVLRYQEDLTPNEIAATLSVPLQSVKSNLKRGLHLLRRKANVTLEGKRQ